MSIFVMIYLISQFHAKPPPQPFYSLFPGPPTWASARRKLLLDFMVLWRRI